MIRKETYLIDEVLCETVYHGVDNEDSKIDFDGDLIKMNSMRYNVFKQIGTECLSCGIGGSFFAKEKDKNSKGYHFNLYALDGEKEILMTKKRINHVKKGEGCDRVENYLPMCEPCNYKYKGVIK